MLRISLVGLVSAAADTIAGADALVIVDDWTSDFDGSTTVTRNRDTDDVEKLVGEQLFDGGGVIGEVLDSMTRDTWKRLLDGLGTGDDTGDGIGLGNGDRSRPLVLRFGSSR